MGGEGEDIIILYQIAFYQMTKVSTLLYPDSVSCPSAMYSNF